VLNLAGNVIEFLYDRAFDGLSNLLSLSLASNRINYMSYANSSKDSLCV